MVSSHWITEEQHAFLSAKLEESTQSQLTRRVAAFFEEVQSEWTEKWPAEKAVLGETGPTRNADMTEGQAEAVNKAYSKLTGVCAHYQLVSHTTYSSSSIGLEIKKLVLQSTESKSRPKQTEASISL